MCDSCVLCNRTEVASGSDIPGSGVIEEKTSNSLSIVSASIFVATQGKKGEHQVHRIAVDAGGEGKEETHPKESNFCTSSRWRVFSCTRN